MEKLKLSSGVSISYQDEGDKRNPAIILIMGLGAQMTVWPDEFYFNLVNSGFRVIRFDNRDVGKSSKFNQYGKPSLIKTWLRKRLNLKTKTPYLLDDMAEDVLLLMSALKIKRAHLIGASMGGMIAQIIAAKYRKKVVSLTSIMSTPSSPTPSRSNMKLFLKLAKRPNINNREEAIKYTVKLNQLIGSPAYPIDHHTLHQHATFHVDRDYSPEGTIRQLAAITASGNRHHLLKKIKTKALIIHGDSDPVIPVSFAKETASNIAKTKLKIIEGMGHDFPPQVLNKMTKWIIKHVVKAEEKRNKKKELKKQVDVSAKL